MSQHADHDDWLDPDPGSVATIRVVLEQVGYDLAQQVIRPDYFTSPYPHYETMLSMLDALPEQTATALLLLALAEPVQTAVLERTLGREFVEAGLVTKLLDYDLEQDRFSTNGATIISRLGQYAVVSAHPFYPTFLENNAAVYMGQDSFTFVHHLQRLSVSLSSSGKALDLCCGSGIAGQSLAMCFSGQQWTGVDLSGEAVAAARFNAMLNGVEQRYQVRRGNLFDPIGEDRFEVITCNPPFIPVPGGSDFPIYGSGGEDGLRVLRPLLNSLDQHLTDAGQALIYAEGIGDDECPFLIPLLQRGVETARWNVELTIIANVTIDRALYTLGVMLARQRPSRLEEIVKWKDLFERQGATRYYKYLVRIRRGAASMHTMSVALEYVKA